MNMRYAIPLGVLALACPAAAEVDASALAVLFTDTCLSPTPPGLLETPVGFVAVRDRETFAGPADLYWTRPGGDESARVGVTFTTTTRSCEFVVDDRALDPSGLQFLAAQAILAIQTEATRQGVTADVTAPENIPTFQWVGVPASFTDPFAHRFEVFQTATQTLIRGVITTTY